jgi:hypothetical protein
MRVERTLLDNCNLGEFADRHGLVMRVTGVPNSLHASFQCCEVGGDGLLRSVYGIGPTEDHAFRDYAQKISGKLLVINAYKDTRREILAPVLWW